MVASGSIATEEAALENCLIKAMSGSTLPLTSKIVWH